MRRTWVYMQLQHGEAYLPRPHCSAADLGLLYLPTSAHGHASLQSSSAEYKLAAVTLIPLLTVIVEVCYSSS